MSASNLSAFNAKQLEWSIRPGGRKVCFHVGTRQKFPSKARVVCGDLAQGMVREKTAGILPFRRFAARIAVDALVGRTVLVDDAGKGSCFALASDALAGLWGGLWGGPVPPHGPVGGFVDGIGLIPFIVTPGWAKLTGRRSEAPQAGVRLMGDTTARTRQDGMQ